MTSVPTSAVLVTGMHRSGTSALTRCIALLGFDLGRGPHLAATPTNVHGHWEPRSMVEIDDDLLAELGGTWACPPAPREGAARQAASGSLGDRARSMVREQFRSPFVLKDPRAALVLDFWLEVLPASTAVVLVLRHPSAVATSLCARDGLSMAQALALWERYTRAALAAVEGRRVAVVRYEQVVADPLAELRELQEWLPRADGGDVVDPAAASLDPSVMHHTAMDCAAFTSSQRELWEEVQALVGHHASLRPALRSVETPGLQELFEDQRRLLELTQRVDRLQGEVHEASAREAQLRAREAELLGLLDAEREHRGALDAELASIVAEATRLDALLADRQRILDVLTVARLRRPLRDRLRRRRR